MSAAVPKFMACIQALTLTPTGLTATEVAKQTGLSRPAAVRLLDALLEDSVVVRDNRSKKYRLGLLLYEWASKSAHAVTPLTIARREMIRLTATTERGYHFFVLEGGDAIMLEGTEWIDGEALSIPVPTHMAWYQTASGKAIAAFSAPEIQRRLLGEMEMKVRDGQKVEQVVGELDKAKERGYAEARGEWREDIYGLAVPIFDIDGYALAAIGAITTAAELNPASTGSLLSPMFGTSSKISAYLGYHAPQLSVIA
jgi:DNA-binding IclR family transcriptional regulator